jgi:hypothetical protein
MSAFYTYCHSAGPSLCAFHSSSPQLIETRLSSLLSNIKKHPVIVPAPSTSSSRPEIVSYSTVQRVISSSLYRPLIMFPAIASALSALEAGDGLPLLTLSGQSFSDSLLCNNPDSGSDEGEGIEDEGSADASRAIMCSDNGGWWDSVEGVEAYVQILQNISKSAGATMAEMRLGCVGWTIQAKWRFTGPFEANTSHPILFIANKADNVTPLRSAQQNAKGFPGSGVLVSNSYGHTSLSTPSRCIAKHIQIYFQSGTLPPPNTVCEPDLVPFESWDLNSTAVDMIEEGKGERELDRAMVELMRAPVFGV